MYHSKKRYQWLACLLIIFLIIALSGCKSSEKDKPSNPAGTSPSGQKVEQVPKEQSRKENIGTEIQVEKGLSYSTKDEVAAYIHKFRELPPNYINKKEARDLGWDDAKGNLWEVTDRKSIGGDRFGNWEGLLPKADHRQYYECDVNYQGGYRSDERIVYSNDGLIFYTDDHYQTFEQLY